MASKTMSKLIKYSKAGTKPPIYLAGSFSTPPWEVQEMVATQCENSEYKFTKEVQVEEGKDYQYKFRLGDGDWWVLDEDAPTVTDDIGNRNNHFSVPIRTQDSMDQELSDKVAGAAERSSVPVTVLEKAGGDPKHGDDFGPEATASRKVAHEKRAADADPDFVVVKEEENITDESDVAAQVADSAVLLDKEASTPPVSDDVAGRTGLRRLSNTPIQDVARIAAEVAQSAASLDKDDQDENEMDDKQKVQREAYPPIPESEDMSSGYNTPAQDRVPLFSHECCSPPSDDEPEEHDQAPHIEIHNEDGDPPIDVNDPTLEEFPCDRDLVLEKVRTLETSLDADRTSFDGTASSPVVGFNYKGERIEISPPPSSVLRTPDMSPSLDSIMEESGEKEDLPSLPSREGSEEGNEKEAGHSIFQKQKDKQPDSPPADNTLTNMPSPQPLKTVDGVDEVIEPLVSSEETAANLSRRGFSGDISTASGQNIIVSTASLNSTTVEKMIGGADGIAHDTAESTAIIAENGNSELKSRRQQATPPIDSSHSLSSSSSQRSSKHESRNALKHFCRLTWVDWLGGAVMKLCGGRHHT
ncbi:hypothetical protein B7463_g6630, partial [Scytalidium lignicola]